MRANRTCPICGSCSISTERRLDGNIHCVHCDERWPNNRIDIEAALAERDARIAEWDKEIKRVKTKLELVYCMLDEMKSQYEFCDCSDDSDDDICIGCRLTEILSDMRAEVPSET